MPDREDFYHKLLNSIGDGVYYTDRERCITFWNKGAVEITGYTEEEVLGRFCRDNILIHVDAAGNRLCLNGCPLSKTMATGIPQEDEVFLHHRDGHRVPVLVRAFPMMDSSGEIVGAVEVFSNNSKRALREERLAEMESLALTDVMTSLPNRRHLEDHIRSRLEELRRNHWSFGVLFIDIDNFKQFNDLYGHDVGDKVLAMVGRTLNETSRIFDVVGRWGGEEFLAIISNTNEVSLREVGERFRALVESSGLSGPVSVGVTISLGGADALPWDTMDTLVKRADDKLYHAKQAGRNRVCV